MSRAATVTYGLLLAAACRAIQIFLEAQSTAALVGQAVLVEWGTSRLGVTWSPEKEKNDFGRIVRRAGIGAAVGIAVGSVVLGVLVLSRGADFVKTPNLAVSVLVIGFLTSALGAWRDELLQHGVLLRALQGTPDIVKVVACGITSGGAAIGLREASARSVFVAALLGIIMGALWVRDRGAWMPCAASAFARFAIRTLFAGGLVTARIADTSWGGGTAGMLGGAGAAVALVPLAIFALLLTIRRPESRPLG